MHDTIFTLLKRYEQILYGHSALITLMVCINEKPLTNKLTLWASNVL